MRSAHVILGALAAVLAATTFAAAAPLLPSAEWLLAEVRALAAPENDGRASGTAGADRAAQHLAAVMQEAGLVPGGDGGGWFQAFVVPTGVRRGPVNTLDVLAPAPRRLAVDRDFTPLAVSADGEVEGEVVFAGYGITAPDLGYDDYAGIEAHGKIVLVIGGEPRRADPASPFRKPEAYHYSERSHKVINAREHGARAILLVAPPTAAGEPLPPLRGIAHPSSILTAFITHAAGDALLAPSGRRLAGLADAIDRALAPASFLVPSTRVRLHVTLVRDHGTARNVVGILPGRDPGLSAETVVIGAHYDHLGRGGEGSLAPDQVGAIHFGADDNASGTATVLGLARAFAASGVPRTLVFVAFAGEEMGLLGSTHYVRHPARPLDSTVLMINFDMVGRLRERTLYVGGVDSGTGLRALVTAAAGTLRLEMRGDPYGPSDQTPFYAAGRPVLFLFTGPHADYHRPTDTPDKINAGGMAEVAAFAARVIERTIAQPVPPAYVRVQGPAVSIRAGGYGPFFGVVPDFGESAAAGARVGSVRPGSPADRAGVATGDVIVSFAGMTVRTLEDFTFALRTRRPGDRVGFTVVRDGAERRLEATLEERR